MREKATAIHHHVLKQFSRDCASAGQDGLEAGDRVEVVLEAEAGKDWTVD